MSAGEKWPHTLDIINILTGKPKSQLESSTVYDLKMFFVTTTLRPFLPFFISHPDSHTLPPKLSHTPLQLQTPASPQQNGLRMWEKDK